MKVRASRFGYAAIGLTCFVVLVLLARETTPGQSLLRQFAGGSADQVPTTRGAAVSTPPAAASGDLYQLRKAIRELETKIAGKKRVLGDPLGRAVYRDAKKTFEREESLLRKLEANLDEKTRAGLVEVKLVELRKAVREQEDTVDQRRNLLQNVIRGKALIYEGPDIPPVPLKVLDPEAGRRQLDADQATLRQLKLALRNRVPAAEGEPPSTPSD